jgi:hypothetical protein
MSVYKPGSFRYAKYDEQGIGVDDPNGSGAAVPGGGISASIGGWAGNLDAIITGAIVRNANGAATSAPVTWPDGAVGAYTATSLSSAFPGAVDAYTVTYVSGDLTLTATQPAVTRDANGAVISRPAITVM